MSAIRAVTRRGGVPSRSVVSALSPSTDKQGVGADLTAATRGAGDARRRVIHEEIGSGLFLSLHTVRNHVRNILTKLHARTKLEAVVIAARAGLVDLRPDT